MAEKQFKIGKTQVILSHSSNLLKIIVAVLIVLSIAALVALNFVSDNIRNRTEDMQAQTAELEKENHKLEEKIDNLGTNQSIQQIAQEELGLIDPDTVLIKPE